MIETHRHTRTKNTHKNDDHHHHHHHHHKIKSKVTYKHYKQKMASENEARKGSLNEDATTTTTTTTILTTTTTKGAGEGEEGDDHSNKASGSGWWTHAEKAQAVRAYDEITSNYNLKGYTEHEVAAQIHQLWKKNGGREIKPVALLKKAKEFRALITFANDHVYDEIKAGVDCPYADVNGEMKSGKSYDDDGVQFLATCFHKVFVQGNKTKSKPFTFEKTKEDELFKYYLEQGNIFKRPTQSHMPAVVMEAAAKSSVGRKATTANDEEEGASLQGPKTADTKENQKARVAPAKKVRYNGSENNAKAESFATNSELVAQAVKKKNDIDEKYLKIQALRDILASSEANFFSENKIRKMNAKMCELSGLDMKVFDSSEEQ